MNKGQCITLSITDLNNLGCGVGKAEDGRVVFVKGSVTGDTVRAEVIKVNKSFCVARLLEILSPSPHRIDSDPCSAPLSCGGCIYRHITYEHERQLKRDYIESAFRKAGLKQVTVLPVMSAGTITGYRNKGQYPVTETREGLRAGFFAAKSHRIIPADACAIQHKAFAPIVADVCRFGDTHGWSAYREESGTGLLRHIYLRAAEATDQILLCLVINGTSLPHAREFVGEMREKHPNLVGILLNENRENTNVVLGKAYTSLWGTPYIEDELCGLTFRISPDSFYQINRTGAELLYGIAAHRAELHGNEILMDLYCGTGTIGLTMANRAKKLCGVEIVPAAVDCARENALRNGIANAEFFCADAGDPHVILSAAGGVRPDVVVIDPPRKGTTEQMVRCLAQLAIPRIVYVSCNPDTLARDCACFAEQGYKIGEIQPVDLFPRTGHVESVCLLKR